MLNHDNNMPRKYNYREVLVLLSLIMCVPKIAKKDYKPRHVVCLSVRPSVHMEQLDSYWTHFHVSWYLMIFKKIVERIQVSLKHDKNKGYFTWRPLYIYNNISLISSNNGKCFWQKCKEAENMHFRFETFFYENHGMYDIMWKSVEPDRLHMTI
jgi:hypothetical protein